VVLEDNAIDLFQGGLESRDLFHHFGAITFFLHHPDDGVEMSPHGPEAVERRCPMGFLHGSILPHPGWGIHTRGLWVAGRTVLPSRGDIDEAPAEGTPGPLFLGFAVSGEGERT
jgi:hypothetical protein